MLDGLRGINHKVSKALAHRLLALGEGSYWLILRGKLITTCSV